MKQKQRFILWPIYMCYDWYLGSSSNEEICISQHLIAKLRHRPGRVNMAQGVN